MLKYNKPANIFNNFKLAEFTTSSKTSLHLLTNRTRVAYII